MQLKRPEMSARDRVLLEELHLAAEAAQEDHLLHGRAGKDARAALPVDGVGVARSAAVRPGAANPGVVSILSGSELHTMITRCNLSTASASSASSAAMRARVVRRRQGLDGGGEAGRRRSVGDTILEPVFEFGGSARLGRHREPVHRRWHHGALRCTRRATKTRRRNAPVPIASCSTTCASSRAESSESTGSTSPCASVETGEEGFREDRRRPADGLPGAGSHGHDSRNAVRVAHGEKSCGSAETKAAQNPGYLTTSFLGEFTVDRAWRAGWGTVAARHGFATHAATCARASKILRPRSRDLARESAFGARLRATVRSWARRRGGHRQEPPVRWSSSTRSARAACPRRLTRARDGAREGRPLPARARDASQHLRRERDGEHEARRKIAGGCCCSTTASRPCFRSSATSGGAGLGPGAERAREPPAAARRVRASSDARAQRARRLG